jgi:hypothetical protein
LYPATAETYNRDLGLFFHVWAAAAYQLNMTIRGRLLRGGIAFGNAYADNTFVTGPAHLRAVILEETVAVNPRIVLDEECVELAREELDHGGDADKLNSPYGTSLLCDADGQTFINYLVAVSEDEGWDAGLTEHKKKVEQALASSASAKVLAKLQWVAAYHNYVCETFYDHPTLTIAGIAPVAFKRFS